MMGSRTMLAVICAAVLLAAADVARAAAPCTTNCSSITVGSGTAAPGSTVSIPVSFAQGPNDGQGDQGNDDIAAIALTIGIPGTATGDPLTLDCQDNNGDGLPDGVQPDSSIADTLRVVVENAECTNRNRCLCPGAGQTQDNFVNLAIYGPKDLPAEGPVEIPLLPTGRLLTLGLRVPAGAAPDSKIPLTIFADVDGHSTIPKPQFGAFFSQGDRSAVDQTVDSGSNRAKVQVQNGEITVGAGGEVCVGDCNDDKQVTVDELVRGVNIALGSQPVTVCPSFDRNNNGEVTVDELIAGVNNALSGCP